MHLGHEQIESLRRVLKGEKLVPVHALFEITRSLSHGHDAAVLGAKRAHKFDELFQATEQALDKIRQATRVPNGVLRARTASACAPAAPLTTSRWASTSRLEIGEEAFGYLRTRRRIAAEADLRHLRDPHPRIGRGHGRRRR